MVSNPGSIPSFSVEIRHLGEKTTIVRPELYVFVREPDGPSEKVRAFKREEWDCCYKRILTDIRPSEGIREPFPPPSSHVPPDDRFVYFLLTHMQRYFRFSPINNAIGEFRSQYAIGIFPHEKPPIPMLVRVEYQVGLANLVRQAVEREYFLTLTIIPLEMGMGAGLATYGVASAKARRLPWLRNRFLRDLRGKQGINDQPSTL